MAATRVLCPFMRPTFRTCGASWHPRKPNFNLQHGSPSVGVMAAPRPHKVLQRSEGLRWIYRLSDLSSGVGSIFNCLLKPNQAIPTRTGPTNSQQDYCLQYSILGVIRFWAILCLWSIQPYRCWYCFNENSMLLSFSCWKSFAIDFMLSNNFCQGPVVIKKGPL